MFAHDTFDNDSNFPFLLGKMLGYSFLAAVATIMARDIGWYFLDLPTRDQTKATGICYGWFARFLPELEDGEVIDYSEGLFDENKPGMTLQEATVAKYKYIANALDLNKPSESGKPLQLLDAGCGSGVWLDYCRSIGVDGIGLTLSPEQVDIVRKKGLTAEVRDYRVPNPAFIGKFDAITALGSTEHVSSSRGALSDNSARERSIQTLTEIWTLFQTYLKPGGKIFITALTFNENVTWSLMDRFQMYVLDQHYGGYYPRISDIQFKIAPAAGLTLTHLADQTASYHRSSMVEPKHFGYFTVNWRQNTWDKVSYTLKSLVKNPLQVPFHWLYQAFDTWMWQFGGPQNKFLSPEQVAKAPMQLKWFMMTPTASKTGMFGQSSRPALPETPSHPDERKPHRTAARRI